MYWQLNRVIYPVYNLGPGKRLAIWVQGCSTGCSGCISPDLWDFKKGRQVDVALFASALLNMTDTMDGITITGGEPFDQYNALVSFCSFIKMKSDVEIMVFSGYTLQHLKSVYSDLLFMRCIDYLIDGPYMENLKDDRYLRGSANQKMYRFDTSFQKTERESPDEMIILEENFPEPDPRWSVEVDEKNQVFMSGIPKSGDFNEMIEQLKRSGIKFELMK